MADWPYSVHTNVFWGVLAAPVRLINVLVRLVRVARFTVVVLEVREPAGGRERAGYAWSRPSRFFIISVLYVDRVGVPMAVL